MFYSNPVVITPERSKLFQMSCCMLVEKTGNRSPTGWKPVVLSYALKAD
ncbi:MAG: hypothetical protein IJ599_00140 [Alphaproteobacteria bacterium]|nr:hypothetical protein [Alphaproteobacteria bacterium]